jgi:hypothetical protein
MARARTWRTRVRYDETDRSWRIYVRDVPEGAREGSHGGGFTWYPLLWLKFASKEAAENHVAWRGAS